MRRGGSLYPPVLALGLLLALVDGRPHVMPTVPRDYGTGA